MGVSAQRSSRLRDSGKKKWVAIAAGRREARYWGNIGRKGGVGCGGGLGGGGGGLCGGCVLFVGWIGGCDFYLVVFFVFFVCGVGLRWVG